MATTTTTGTAGNDTQAWLESILPGVGNLTSSATGVIGNLLNGLPSASQARTTNAYWGIGAGQPATGDITSFIGQRGTDLYGQQAQQNQQTGLQDLLQTLGSYTSPALSNQGQNLQNQQFGQSLAQSGSEFNQSQGQQASEFNQTNQLNQLQVMLKAMGL